MSRHVGYTHVGTTRPKERDGVPDGGTPVVSGGTRTVRGDTVVGNGFPGRRGRRGEWKTETVKEDRNTTETGVLEGEQGDTKDPRLGSDGDRHAHYETTFGFRDPRRNRGRKDPGGR